MRTLKPKHKLAIIQSGIIKSIGANFDEEIDVTHEPIGHNLSHSAIWGVPPEQKISLREELAAEASQDIRSVILPK